MADSLKVQHGGSHYKNMRLQPIQFAMVNRYDPGAFSVLKYISRHRSKNGREDLMKARHFVELRRDILRVEPHCAGFNALDVIPVSEYISENSVPAAEAAILIDLHFWATGMSNLGDSVAASWLLQKIDLLMERAYPQAD